MSLLQISLLSAGLAGGGASFTPPSPGSNNPPGALNEMYGDLGTPYNPLTGDSGGASPYTAALYRRTYLGYWCNPSSYVENNPSIFNGSPIESYPGDNYIAFGSQTTGDQYCMEWKGYWRPPTTGNWNFKVSADDVIMFWIGDNALSPNSSNWQCNNGYNGGLNYNSVILTQGLWYPIRVRYQEWGGAEFLNIFASVSGSTEMTALYNYGYANQGYNPVTGGYN